MENIHEYLTTVSENVRAGKIKLDEFIIFKVCSYINLRDIVLTASVAAGQEPRRLP